MLVVGLITGCSRPSAAPETITGSPPGGPVPPAQTPATTAPAASPAASTPAGRSHTSASASPATGDSGTSAKASHHPAHATTRPTTGKRTRRATTSTKPAQTHTGRDATTPPGTPSTGDLIAAATSEAAAAGVAPANPDTPGPDSGPPCPANSKYVNEKPTGLRTDVIAAWQKAVSTAADQGITLCLNDGKRSRGQQQAQYQEYVEEYGTKVANELVLPPNKSAHVIGIAVDVQPADGYQWLQATAGSLGFCRIYDNEPWHFEFNPAYRSDGCPARLPEPER